MAYPTDFCACCVNLTHLHWGRLVTYPYFTWLYIQQTVPHPLTHTYSGKGIIQVVYGPRNNHNVVNIEPKGQDCSSQPHTCKGNKEKWNKGTFSWQSCSSGQTQHMGQAPLRKSCRSEDFRSAITQRSLFGGWLSHPWTHCRCSAPCVVQSHLLLLLLLRAPWHV